VTSHRSTFTSQLYCGILLGVNLDIPSLLWNFYADRWNDGSLQNGEFLSKFVTPQDVGL